MADTNIINSIRQTINHITSTIQSWDNVLYKGVNIVDVAKTRDYLVLPLVHTLGWNLFSYSEVVRDYKNNDSNIELVLTKSKNCSIGMTIRAYNAYFKPETLEAIHKGMDTKIVIETNGCTYNFYSRDKQGILDNSPFYTLNLVNPDINTYHFLSAFERDKFNPAQITEGIRGSQLVQNISDVLVSLLTAKPDEMQLDFITKYVNSKSGIRNRSATIAGAFSDAQALALKQIYEMKKTEPAKMTDTSAQVVEAVPEQGTAKPATKSSDKPEDTKTSRKSSHAWIKELLANTKMPDFITCCIDTGTYLAMGEFHRDKSFVIKAGARINQQAANSVKNDEGRSKAWHEAQDCCEDGVLQISLLSSSCSMAAMQVLGTPTSGYSAWKVDGKPLGVYLLSEYKRIFNRYPDGFTPADTATDTPEWLANF